MSATLDAYGALHTAVNETVSAAAGRSVSVTASRLLSSGRGVVSALASKSTGELVRVVIDAETGDRLDTETGRIADALASALAAMSATDRAAYVLAWRRVFAPDSIVPDAPTDADRARALTDANMAADFYSAVAMDATGRVGVVGESIVSDGAGCDDADARPAGITYAVNAPYDAAATVSEPVTYPAASGALSWRTVEGMMQQTGPLEPGQAYALQTVELDRQDLEPGDYDEGVDPCVGYLAVLTIVNADALTFA